MSLKCRNVGKGLNGGELSGKRKNWKLGNLRRVIVIIFHYSLFKFIFEIAHTEAPSKKWNLEDDDDDDEDENKEDKKEKIEEEELDPLDAFMEDVEKEVSVVTKADMKKAESQNDKSGKGLVILTGVARKKDEKNKGELIEQNQDGLEYSSEEEEEDLKLTIDGLANKQKKELAKVDHTTVEYQPFRKNFYIEVPELSRMTQAEVEAFREESEGIKVKGKACPKPIKEWAQCGVSKKVLDVLKKSNFEKPTPIQTQAIPAIMSGRDLIGIAKTGSGKTLAFLLPMFRHILDQPPLEDTEGPIALVMTPTRELSMQIGKDCRRYLLQVFLFF